MAPCQWAGLAGRWAQRAPVPLLPFKTNPGRASPKKSYQKPHAQKAWPEWVSINLAERKHKASRSRFQPPKGMSATGHQLLLEFQAKTRKPPFGQSRESPPADLRSGACCQRFCLGLGSCAGLCHGFAASEAGSSLQNRQLDGNPRNLLDFCRVRNRGVFLPPSDNCSTLS